MLRGELAPRGWGERSIPSRAVPAGSGGRDTGPGIPRSCGRPVPALRAERAAAPARPGPAPPPGVLRHRSQPRDGPSLRPPGAAESREGRGEAPAAGG